MLFSKPKYPSKRSINLAKKEMQLREKQLLIVGSLALLLLVCLVKFGFVNRIQEVEKAKELYYRTEQQIALLNERVKDYETVANQYRQYDDSFLSEDEAGEVDRLDIISMIESCIKDNASIQGIRITSNQALITLEETTLTNISDMVALLEAQERTSYVTVYTAETNKEKEDEQMISADIMVQLKSEVSTIE